MANQNAHLSLAELERIAEKILKLSAAEETEVDVSAATDALTRFANNTIHQNVAEENTQISVRVSFGGRTARASPPGAACGCTGMPTRAGDLPVTPAR